MKQEKRKEKRRRYIHWQQSEPSKYRLLAHLMAAPGVAVSVGGIE